MDRMSRVLQRYLLVWLIALSTLAYAWMRLGDWAGITYDPFAASKPYLPALIAVTMFSIGCLLPRDEVNNVFTHWPLVLGGTAVQYTTMPLLAFLVGRIWDFEGDQLVGIVLVGCVPGAMASNILTMNAKGDTSYSVSLTTVATLLSPLIVPLALRMTLVRSDMMSMEALWNSSYLLLRTVVLPVVAGHVLTRFVPAIAPGARVWGPFIANLVILWIIAVVVGLNRDRLVGHDLPLWSALLVLNFLGYFAGYASGWLFRMREPMRRALTLEVGMQNAGLGATLATQLFPDRDATAIAPALYTFGCMLTGTVLAQAWTSFAERNIRSQQDRTRNEDGTSANDD